MAFEVRIRINKSTIKLLSVSSSSEEFENFTIRKLKRKALSFFPGVDDPNSLRVIFGQNELEDDQTFASCNIEHLSLLVIVLRMPGGGGSPDPGETEAQKKVNTNAGRLGFLKFVSSSLQKTTGKSVPANPTPGEQYSKTNCDLKAGSSTQQRPAEERKSKPQIAATAPFSIISAQPRNLSSRTDVSVLMNPRERKEERVDSPPAEASSVQSDPDLQFLHSLLPSLKRMDLRRREHTKLRIQQLVFEAEFDDSGSSDVRVRRSDSLDFLPPQM